MDPQLRIKGRGSHAQPANPYERIRVEPDSEHLAGCAASDFATPRPESMYFVDQSKSLVTENDSPDIPFRYSVNPYRGCAHGCAYCYARPTHEYLGWNAGLDFETKVLVKQRAPQLFRHWLARRSCQCEPIMFSGVTDCYQPIERQLELTRHCLAVAFQSRQPLMIITKNSLITRDLDILADMARRNLIHVAISITTLDAHLAGNMEPRTSRPAARLRTIAQLSDAGVPTSVMMAPIIPGLTDVEIPAVLREAKKAGARRASHILLRLPQTVAVVFREWLQRVQPSHARRIESRIRQTRGGELYQSQFGTRLCGTGPLAEQIQQTFDMFRRRFGLDQELPPLDTTQFRPPADTSGQGWLF